MPRTCRAGCISSRAATPASGLRWDSRVIRARIHGPVRIHVRACVGLRAYTPHQGVALGAKNSRHGSAVPPLKTLHGAYKQAAKELARRKAIVHMLCRNAERGEAARAGIVKETGNEQVRGCIGRGRVSSCVGVLVCDYFVGVCGTKVCKYVST